MNGQKKKDFYKVISKHFGSFRTDDDEDDLQEIVEIYQRAQSEALLQIYDVAPSRKKLEKIRAGLVGIEKTHEELPLQLKQILFLLSTRRGLVHQFARKSGEDPSVNFEDRPFPFPCSPIEGLMIMIPLFIPILDEAIDIAKRAVPVGTRAVKAWRVYDAAEKTVHWFCPDDIGVPKRLGSSGAFYRFVVDLFEMEGISEDPVNIARSWANHVGWSQ